MVQPDMFWVLHICPDILMSFLVFYECVLLKFLAKHYLVIDHIIDTIVSMTFLFGVIAISHKIYHRGQIQT